MTVPRVVGDLELQYYALSKRWNLTLPGFWAVGLSGENFSKFPQNLVAAICCVGQEHGSIDAPAQDLHTLEWREARER